MNIFWKIAINNLKRNKRRTLATAFTICFGYVGLSLLSGYIIHVEKATKALMIYVNHVGHISIYNKDGLNQFYAKPSKYQIDEGLQKKINSVLQSHQNEVEKIGLNLSGMGLLSNGKRSIGVIIEGLDPALQSYIRQHPVVREVIPEFAKNDNEEDLSFQLNKNPDAISVTKAVGELLGRDVPFTGLSAEDRDLQLAGKSMRGDFNAVNVNLGARHLAAMAYSNDSSVIAPLATLQKLMDTNGVSFISLYLKEGVSVTKVLQQLKAEFAKNNLDVDVYPFYDEGVGMFYVGTLSFLLSLGFFIFILILATVVLSVINTITMGIIERTREIGTLRAMGYRPMQISRLFVMENFSIALGCVLLGTVMTYLLAFWINSLKVYFKPTGIAEPIQFVVTPELWSCCVIALPVILLTCLTAYVVSFRKTRLPIVQLFTDTGASS